MNKSGRVPAGQLCGNQNVMAYRFNCLTISHCTRPQPQSICKSESGVCIRCLGRDPCIGNVLLGEHVLRSRPHLKRAVCYTYSAVTDLSLLRLCYLPGLQQRHQNAKVLYENGSFLRAVRTLLQNTCKWGHGIPQKIYMPPPKIRSL